MKYEYDKAARTIRIVPSVDLTRDVVTVEIPALTMKEMGWTTIPNIQDALKPTRVVISPPSPCRAPAEPLTAGQRAAAEGIARALSRQDDREWRMGWIS